MKRLTINYGDTTLFDDQVEELTWQDSSEGVQVAAKYKKAPGLIERLQDASKAQTEQKRREVTADVPVPVGLRQSTTELHSDNGEVDCE
jgi:hypothetical protein